MLVEATECCQCFSIVTVNLKCMATLRIELSSRPRQDGLHLLMLRITKDRKHKRVSAERYIRKAEFNPVAGFGRWVRTTNPGHAVINDHLKELITRYEEIETELLKMGNPVTLTGIKHRGKNQQDDRFIPYGQNEVARCLAKGLYRSSVKKKQVLAKLERFAGKEVRFADIDVPFLKKYTHEQLTKGKKANTIGTDHKAIRSIFKAAIADGLVPAISNPYLQFRISWEKTHRAKLSEEEIESLEALKVDEGTLSFHVLNMFLFSYYTAGMRFGDVLLLRWSDVVADRLVYRMAKTGDVQNIRLSTRAKQILTTYQKGKPEPQEFIFPLLRSEAVPIDYFGLTRVISAKNALVNKYLKKLTKSAGIAKNVSFHISRHSFAFMAIHKTGDVYAVSKSLRHKNLKTTDVYLEETDNTAADKVLNMVFR